MPGFMVLFRIGTIRSSGPLPHGARSRAPNLPGVRASFISGCRLAGSSTGNGYATKLAAVCAYRTQVDKFRYDEAVEGLNRFRGALAARCLYAEAYSELNLNCAARQRYISPQRGY
jgi:hypothetical protein